MALFGDENLQSQYDNILSRLQGSGAYNPLTLPEQTIDSITAQLAQIYRPQVEQAILRRQGATKQQKASIDVDAASRGMGTSTWVTDAKNRIMGEEAADVAGLESDYASQLAGDAMTQYQNYLGDKLKLDQYNQQLQAALQGEAYNQAMQQYQMGMVEGTLPYKQAQLEWEQIQKKAKGGGKNNGGLPDWLKELYASLFGKGDSGKGDSGNDDMDEDLYESLFGKGGSGNGNTDVGDAGTKGDDMSLVGRRGRPTTAK